MGKNTWGPRWLLIASAVVVGASGSVGCGDDAVGTAAEDSGAADGNADGTTTDAGTTDTGTTDTGTTDTGTTDGGAPNADFAKTPIDLGLVDCGGTATAKSFTVKNTGNKTLTVSAAITGTGFTVTPTSLTVAPGDTGTMTFGGTVAATSTAGAVQTGSVTLTTNVPGLTTATIPLTATAQGATLSFNAGSLTSADFGLQKNGQAATPLALTVKNTGNKSAAFAFGTPSNAQFSLTATPASPVTLAAAATASLSAGFTPNALTASTGSSAITVTGAVCGAASVKKIDFSGQGTLGAVAGWPTSTFDFGLNNCGGAAPVAKTFTLVNSGAAPVVITGVTFTGTAGYGTSLTAGTSTVPASGSLVVTVTAPAIPATSAVPGSYAGSVSITTDLPADPAHVIALNESAQGAILAFNTSATPGFGSFGNVPVGTSASQGFSVVNTGNAATTVTLSTTTPFSVASSSFALAGGSTAQTDTAAFTPTTTTPQTASLAMTASGLCQPLPSPRALSGTGQNGGISLPTTSLSFAADCNTTATSKTFTIVNSGNLPMSWTATLGQGSSLYTISPASGGPVAPGDSSTVTVQPNAILQFPGSIAPAAFADVVTILTNIIGDTTPHTVSLSETPLGAVITLSPPSIPFGTIPVNTSSTAQGFTLTNSGNAGSAAADITLTTTTTTGSGTFTTSVPSLTVAVGTPSGATATFSPGAAAALSKGTIGFTTTSAICAVLPPSLTMDGTGTLAQVVSNPSAGTIAFGGNVNGLVNCGATASPQTITFTNPGNQDYTIATVKLGNGTTTGPYFSVTPQGAVVTANNGNSADIVVTPTMIPQTVASVPDLGTYSDTLTVTTTAAQDTPHVFQLLMGAKGVILRPLVTNTWNFNAVNFGATGFYNTPLKNDGNVATTLSISGLLSSVFGFSTQSIPASAITQITGSFTPAAVNASYSDAGTLGVPGGTVLCQPLPNLALTLLGQGVSGSNLTISGSFAFASMNCGGATPGQRSVTITNLSNAVLPYSAVVGSSKYTLVSATNTAGIPANGGTGVVTVVPNTITPGIGVEAGSAPYASQVDLSFPSLSQTTSVPITMNVRGAVLQWQDSGPGQFYRAYNGYYDTNQNFSIQNTGNVSINLTGVTAGNAVIMSPTGTVAAGSTFASRFYTSAYYGYCTGYTTVTVNVSGNPVCQPLPTRSQVYACNY